MLSFFWCMHAAIGTTLLLQRDTRGQPSFVENSSPFFGASFLFSYSGTYYSTTTTVLLCAVQIYMLQANSPFHPRCVVALTLWYLLPPGVSRACLRRVPRVTRGVLAKLFLWAVLARFCAGQAFFTVSATAKIWINILSNNIIHCLAESSRKYIGKRFSQW